VRLTEFIALPAEILFCTRGFDLSFGLGNRFDPHLADIVSQVAEQRMLFQLSGELFQLLGRCFLIFGRLIELGVVFERLIFAPCGVDLVLQIADLLVRVRYFPASAH